jgi:phage N-6-adenine-methyltransferase
MVDKVAGNNEWHTPASALAPVKAYGRIGLDPCTTAHNPTSAEHFFTEEDDGLTQDWGGKGLVFVNPPYSTFVDLPDDATDGERLIAKREYMRGLKGTGEALFGLRRKAVSSLIVLWAAKIHAEARRGVELIALLPCGARFSTDYWQQHILIHELRAVCFVSGRIAFIDGRTGRPGKGNNYDSMFYGFNVNAALFCSVFKSTGACLETRRPRAGLMDGFI